MYPVSLGMPLFLPLPLSVSLSWLSLLVVRAVSDDTEAKFCAALRSLLEIVDEELRHRYERLDARY